MVKQFLKFGDDETEKKNFHSSENPKAIGDVEINKIE